MLVTSSYVNTPPTIRLPVTVATPAILTLSKFVCPSTSKSLERFKLPVLVNLANSSLPERLVLNMKLPAPD